MKAMPLLAAIPYRTYQTLTLGPFSFQTFGLMAILGISVGSVVAMRYAARRRDLDPWQVHWASARLTIAGLVGARTSWVLSHLDEIDSPLKTIAIWDGGMQFSGGFLGAILVGSLVFRSWSRRDTWVVVDGLGLGLTVGLFFGRIGCYLVGEHYGRLSDAWYAVRFEDGTVREPAVGHQVLVPGVTFLHPALYEMGLLLVLGATMAVVARRRPTAGTLMAIFCFGYGTGRFLLDLLRVNDDRVLGLTGAQYLMIGIVAGGAWLTMRVIPRQRALPSVSTDPGDLVAAQIEHEVEPDQEPEPA